MVESTREVGGKIDREMRLYITSLVLLAHQIGPMIRSHWMIENGLHWVLDMIFRDDECRVRTDNAPANLATIKHMAYNVMRRAATKGLHASEAQSRRLGRRLPRKPSSRGGSACRRPGRGYVGLHAFSNRRAA